MISKSLKTFLGCYKNDLEKKPSTSEMEMDDGDMDPERKK